MSNIYKAKLPPPVRTWHQHGEVISHWDKAQILAYGEACANDVRAEFISLRKELESYKEREKTMGWNQQ